MLVANRSGLWYPQTTARDCSPGQEPTAWKERIVDSWTSEIKAGRSILGIWQQIPAPMISRFLAQMGWDWIILDLQHGSCNWETAYECIHIIRAAGARPLVRVGIGQTSDVQKALDLGAGGVIVPMVNSREESLRMAAAAKYPPLGERSI